MFKLVTKSVRPLLAVRYRTADKICNRPNEKNDKGKYQHKQHNDTYCKNPLCNSLVQIKRNYSEDRVERKQTYNEVEEVKSAEHILEAGNDKLDTEPPGKRYKTKVSNRALGKAGNNS